MDNIFPKILEILDDPSVYPEKARKPREQRLQELLDWQAKYNEINEYYNLYGMDCVDSLPCEKWLDGGLFRKERHDVNAFYYPGKSKFPMDYTLLMRDKRVFEMFCEKTLGYGKGYVPSLAEIIDGKFYEKGFSYQDFMEKEQSDFTAFMIKHAGEKLVFKQTCGSGGKEVIVAFVEADRVVADEQTYSFQEFLTSLKLKNTSWVIQASLKQHDFMNQLNATSVNCFRMLTYNTGARVVISTALMIRYGGQGALVDNLSSGGCFIGVNPDGTLKEFAFHRASKTKFASPLAGQKVPYFEEAKALCSFMHSRLPELFTVGWDISITEKGPVLIEGNDGWDPFGIQTPPGNHQRDLWNELLKEREAYLKND